MTDQDAQTRNEILVRLAASREELRRVLEPPQQESRVDGVPGDAAGFPRSRTMRMLMSGRGLGTLGAMVGGLLISRPSLALRLMRMLPVGAVAQAVLLRVFSALRSKPEKPAQ